MQSIAALPRVAGLEAVAAATSTGAVSRRTGILAAGAAPSNNRLQQRISRPSWSNSFVHCKRTGVSGEVALRNVVVKAVKVEIQEVGKGKKQSRGLVDVDSLVQGEVGRIALVATLLLGVGTLAATGSADAATVHLRDGLHSSVETDMRALAMGPEGPLLEEFWDNMRRYGLYFLTVASGGIYSLVKPLIDALRNPLTAILVVVVVTGTVYLVGLTVSAMLGINEFQYAYAP